MCINNVTQMATVIGSADLDTGSVCVCSVSMETAAQRWLAGHYCAVDLDHTRQACVCVCVCVRGGSGGTTVAEYDLLVGLRLSILDHTGRRVSACVRACA
jgi:hypothetical protein